MDDLRKKYLSLISGALDEITLEELRVQAVGKKGEISSRMRSLGKMTPEERQKAGPALNALKDEVNSALAAKKMALSDAALEERLKGECLSTKHWGPIAGHIRYRKFYLGSKNNRTRINKSNPRPHEEL